MVKKNWLKKIDKKMNFATKIKNNKYDAIKLVDI